MNFDGNGYDRGSLSGKDRTITRVRITDAEFFKLVVASS